ncbi:MAG: DMT family transporter [Bacteroidales bacterium]|nr:DMT family transporter [Bacteroidales bacterium]
MTTDQHPGFVHWMALLLLVLVWGSSFILIKWGLLSFSANEVGALRIAISFVVLSPLVWKHIRKVPWRKLKYFLMAGIIGNGLPPFLFARAQTVIDSYMAGVLNSLTPLFTLLVGVLLFGIKTRWYNVLGVLIGFGGAVGLLTIANGTQINNAWYGLYVVLAALCYALNMNIIKHFLSEFNALTIASVAFFFIGIPALIYLFAGTNVVATLADEPGAWKSLGYISVLAVLGTAMAMVIHNWLIRQTTALFTSTVTYMMPMVSLAWGLVDGERFLFGYLFWILLILIGVFLANRKKHNPVRWFGKSARST